MDCCWCGAEGGVSILEGGVSILVCVDVYCGGNKKSFIA